jgi:hypothetical protein
MKWVVQSVGEEWFDALANAYATYAKELGGGWKYLVRASLPINDSIQRHTDISTSYRARNLR